MDASRRFVVSSIRQFLQERSQRYEMSNRKINAVVVFGSRSQTFDFLVFRRHGSHDVCRNVSIHALLVQYVDDATRVDPAAVYGRFVNSISLGRSCSPPTPTLSLPNPTVESPKRENPQHQNQRNLNPQSQQHHRHQKLLLTSSTHHLLKLPESHPPLPLPEPPHTTPIPPNTANALTPSLSNAATHASHFLLSASSP